MHHSFRIQAWKLKKFFKSCCPLQCFRTLTLKVMRDVTASKLFILHCEMWPWEESQCRPSSSTFCIPVGGMSVVWWPCMEAAGISAGLCYLVPLIFGKQDDVGQHQPSKEDLSKRTCALKQCWVMVPSWFLTVFGLWPWKASQDHSWQSAV